MTSINITISKQAYAYLKSLKGKKSFSETILSLKAESNKVMQFAGILKNADLQSVSNIRKEINNDWNNRH